MLPQPAVGNFSLSILDKAELVTPNSAVNIAIENFTLALPTIDDGSTPHRLYVWALRPPRVLFLKFQNSDDVITALHHGPRSR